MKVLNIINGVVKKLLIWENTHSILLRGKKQATKVYNIIPFV